MKLLLGRSDVDPNKPSDWFDKTPLAQAAHCGHEGVVKVLIGRDDVDPDEQDRDGRTPLSWAAQKGREGVVKILLGVGAGKPDNYGKTPLWWATSRGHAGVVALLQPPNVSTNSTPSASRGSCPT